MPKAIELLPCPFCGAEAQYRRFGAGNDWLMIECTNPYGACCSMSTTYTKESERILADKWNRRAKPMSDELRKAIDEMFEVVMCSQCKYSDFSKTIDYAYTCKNKLSPCRNRLVSCDFGCVYGQKKEEAEDV